MKNGQNCETFKVSVTKFQIEAIRSRISTKRESYYWLHSKLYPPKMVKQNEGKLNNEESKGKVL